MSPTRSEVVLEHYLRPVGLATEVVQVLPLPEQVLGPNRYVPDWDVPEVDRQVLGPGVSGGRLGPVAGRLHRRVRHAGEPLLGEPVLIAEEPPRRVRDVEPPGYWVHLTVQPEPGGVQHVPANPPAERVLSNHP